MAKKKGPGRPPNPDRHAQPRIALHLEQDLLDELNDYCSSQRLKADRSDVVRLAIREFLQRERSK